MKVLFFLGIKMKKMAMATRSPIITLRIPLLLALQFYRGFCTPIGIRGMVRCVWQC